MKNLIVLQVKKISKSTRWDNSEYKIKTIPAMMKEGKSEEEVLEYVFQRCPTLRWAELKENKKTIMSFYNNIILKEDFIKNLNSREKIIRGEIDWFGNKLD